MEDLDSVTKEILIKVGSIVGVRVYLGIVNGLGSIIYIDEEMKQFKDFIVSFVKNNFKYLKIGDHSLPISGKNIIFFRYPRSMVILFSIKGRVGQLLSFKSLMPKYQDTIENFIGDIDIDSQANEVVIEPYPPEAKMIPSVPVKTIEKLIFSTKDLFLKEIYPIVAKKIKESAKFSLTTSVILNYSDGENSFLDALKRTTMSKEEYMKELYRLYKANVIKIPDYELVQFNCPTCKTDLYRFYPIQLLKESPSNYIRFQVTSPSCSHSSYVTIDKKGKIKANAIIKLRDIENEVDFTELSIDKLIKFFGQDIFFSIFHAIFFRFPVLILESGDLAEKVCNFIRNFFHNVTYGREIQSLPREIYEKMSKKYEDYLVIDLVSNIVVNEPYESEDYDFESKLFRKVLEEEDENVQILKTYSEFERLVLLVDKILIDIEMFEEITEEELIKLMKNKHNIILERSEIPIIKELSDIYYSVDIRKKILKTLVGKVSDFFQGM